MCKASVKSVCVKSIKCVKERTGVRCADVKSSCKGCRGVVRGVGVL